MKRLDLRADPDAGLGEVVDHLGAGGLVAYPTSTVYGLGASCTDAGIAALRDAKGRADDKPFIVLVPSADSIAALDWTEEARELAEIFWPGSLTLVLKDTAKTFPAGVRHPTTSGVAVRVSPNPTTARLVATLGTGLLSTSLNLPGEASATSGDEAGRVVLDAGWRDVFLLDAGTLPPSAPSTVVDCSGPAPVVLREGAVPIDRLRCALPEIHARTD